ncbi:MAG: threonine/serine dehydratase [Roseiflexaceae bacterium]
MRDLIAAIDAAEARIRPHIRETALEYSPLLSQQIGAEIWLKCEHLQYTGSFKVRGALNALLSLPAAERERGVIAASSGNHGAAVAFGAQALGVRATIIVPTHVSPTKLAAIQQYGAEVVLHGDDGLIAELHARELAAQQGLHYISPYNDWDVVAGQGTLGVELVRQLPHFDAIGIAVGGGGLVAGTASYLRSVAPELLVVGCQPSHSPVMAESVAAGRILDLPELPTLSDGTAGGIEAETITFPICQQVISWFEQVPEVAIAAAMRLLIERHHTLVEGAAGVALAGIQQAAARLQGKRVVIVLCGANLSLTTLKKALDLGI